MDFVNNKMQVLIDANKIAIYSNYWLDPDWSGSSVFRLRSSVLYVKAYWVTANKVNSH
jgi:hypothetical protein